MLALADKKVETLNARGYDNAAVYNPAGVGGTHMMYVVPHGDRLADYSLPSDPTASPAPMTALGFLKRVGAYLMGFGVLGVVGALPPLRSGTAGGARGSRTARGRRRIGRLTQGRTTDAWLTWPTGYSSASTSPSGSSTGW